MSRYYLLTSKRKNKKFMIITPEGKRVHFGASGMSDYTIHKDKDRKNRYIARHKGMGNQNWEDPDTAGFWSRWLLWNKPDFLESIYNTEDRFDIDIKPIHHKDIPENLK